jgi:hypothetical protein
MIRVLLVSLSVAAGACLGVTVTTACGSDCGCGPTVPLRSGEFTAGRVDLSSGVDDDLRDLTVTDVLVGDDNSVSLLYHRQGTPGAVIYRANFKSIDGFSEVIEPPSDAGSDAGAER